MPGGSGQPESDVLSQYLPIFLKYIQQNAQRMGDKSPTMLGLSGMTPQEQSLHGPLKGLDIAQRLFFSPAAGLAGPSDAGGAPDFGEQFSNFLEKLKVRVDPEAAKAQAEDFIKQIDEVLTRIRQRKTFETERNTNLARGQASDLEQGIKKRAAGTQELSNRSGSPVAPGLLGAYSQSLGRLDPNLQRALQQETNVRAALDPKFGFGIRATGSPTQYVPESGEQGGAQEIYSMIREFLASGAIKNLERGGALPK